MFLNLLNLCENSIRRHHPHVHRKAAVWGGGGAGEALTQLCPAKLHISFLLN